MSQGRHYCQRGGGQARLDGWEGAARCTRCGHVSAVCRRCHNTMDGGVCRSCDAIPYAHQWWKWTGRPDDCPMPFDDKKPEPMEPHR